LLAQTITHFGRPILIAFQARIIPITYIKMPFKVLEEARLILF